MANIIALTEAASIGLHSMVMIARSDEMMNVGNIAKQIDSSRHHVAKILQRLAKENFISSNRGPTGGFILKKKPEEISLLNIYEAIEGRFEVQSCPGDKEICPFGDCLMGDLSHRLSNEIKEYLASKTLKDYL
ncbi:RrF2 family transcriptional regulator [Alkalitalea saponilacus]|uniref:Transcriptional regulator, BadM/Rrf2 family n=1 Tax=Alkalitalea saponilacus TaxID=889453 RepID=A0A1T5HB33_9BACT|nr:Rrf2 family transcriptional regulator [Alkalitalea saponilacus]ASB50785.1 Rrf2 family transcriptional regulator [Alkalitalea saponilacus]SKC17892.1 transcriptional regulator, BadM/Rrf2 family [Alkalitalea saponilacus]